MLKRTSYKVFVELGTHIHGFKYNYPAQQEYKNSTTALQVYCIKHELHFSTSYTKHILRKMGCKKCGNEQGVLKRTKTYDGFVLKGKEIHGNKFTYPKKQLYKNCYSDLKIICNTCKTEIITNYCKHIIAKSSCRKCFFKNAAKNRRHTYQKFVENATLIHGDKYIYPLLQEYVNAHTPLKVFCKKHQAYFNTNYLRHITAKAGCFICSNREKANKRIHGYDVFVSKAKEIHGDKYDYFPDQVYQNNLTKYPVFCKKHEKIFYTNYSLHVYEKCGCPDCGRKKSKGELVLKNFFIKNNIEFIEEYKPEGLKHERQLSIDFYLPKVNLLVEFQGEQHFRPAVNYGGVETLLPQLKRDQIKRKFAYDNKLELLAIEKYQLKDLDIIFSKYMLKDFSETKI